MRMAIFLREKAQAELICGALFFAMQSCECTFTGMGECKTRPIRVCDIVFRNGAQVIAHNNPNLYLAETVSINFGEQKSNVKDETVS